MEVEGGAGKGKGGKARQGKAKARQGSTPDHVCSRAEGRQPRIFIIIFLYFLEQGLHPDHDATLPHLPTLPPYYLTVPPPPNSSTGEPAEKKSTPSPPAANRNRSRRRRPQQTCDVLRVAGEEEVLIWCTSGHHRR